MLVMTVISDGSAEQLSCVQYIIASFFAHRPYRRKAGHYPKWNGFYLLLYRDMEEGWKLVQIRKNFSYAEFIFSELGHSQMDERGSVA